MADHNKETRIGVRVSNAHAAKLKKITEITRMTKSQFFRQCIEEYNLKENKP